MKTVGYQRLEIGILKRADFMKFLFAILLVFLASTIAYAEWQIDMRKFNSWMRHSNWGSSNYSGADYAGHYATKPECEKARKSQDPAVASRCKCVGSDSPRGGAGGGANLGWSGGHGSSEAFAKHMILNHMLDNLFKAALAPPQDDTAYQEKLRQQQEAAQKAAAIKKEHERQENLQKWQNLQNESAQQLKAQEHRKVQEGAELLALLDTSGSREPLSMESISGGNLEGFNRDKPEIVKNEFQPMDTGRYDTSALPLQKRLQCADYFSQKALAAAKNKDDINARYLNEQAQKVMSGQMTDIECQFPDLPDVPEPPKPPPSADREEIAYYESLINSVQQDIVRLEDIEVKMRKTEAKIKHAEEKKRQAEQTITEVQDRVLTAEEPEEKRQCDDLLAQAQALLQESQDEIQVATDARQTLSDQRTQITAQLKEIQQKTQP